MQSGDFGPALEEFTRMVTESVQAFLEEHPDVASAPEAALALKAAELLDDDSASVTSRSMVMGGYLRAMETLRGMLTPVREESELDRIRARRDAKLRSSAA